VYRTGHVPQWKLKNEYKILVSEPEWKRLLFGDSGIDRRIILKLIKRTRMWSCGLASTGSG
jgi:hypothetical protein